MKLLFDANLSWRLEKTLMQRFPGSLHVDSTGLAHSIDDASIWAYARLHEFVVVSRDNDFVEISARLGAPPYLIFLHVANPSTKAVSAAILLHAARIEAFVTAGDAGIFHL